MRSQNKKLNLNSTESIVSRLFNQPTAPYRETWVLTHIENELKRLKVPYFYDTWGNIIAGVSKASRLKHSERVALVAHTDHPGFHLIKPTKKGWIAKWFGGCPPKIKSARVAIHNPSLPNHVIKGKIKESKLKKNGLFEIILQKKDESLNTSCFGAFDYPGFHKKGHRISTRAADDLAGAAIILGALSRLSKKEQKYFLGIFTRAEEVGFRGTLAVIYQKTLGLKNSIISLEASRQLTGARIGQGPVIRLGDRRTLFDSGVIALIDQAALNLQKKKVKDFKVQRRIMNGGTCEATAFNLHNIKAGGMAVPLGNYHNQRNSGHPGAEFIDLRDVDRAISLCTEFYKITALGENPLKVFVKTLAKDFKKDAPMLKKFISFKGRDLL